MASAVDSWTPELPSCLPEPMSLGTDQVMSAWQVTVTCDAFTLAVTRSSPSSGGSRVVSTRKLPKLMS